MVKDAHKQDIVELTGNRINIINGTLGKLDLQTKDLRGKARLIEITIVHVNAQNAAGASLLEFNGMEAAVASDVEDGGARQIRGQRGSDVLPLYIRKIAQEMMRRGENAIQVDIVEPITHFRDAACEFLVAVQILSYIPLPDVRARCRHR